MGEVSVMSAMLSNIALIVTAIMSDVATVATTITDTPLLFLTVGFLFLGGVIGIFGRLLSRG